MIFVMHLNTLQNNKNNWVFWKKEFFLKWIKKSIYTLLISWSILWYQNTYAQNIKHQKSIEQSTSTKSFKDLFNSYWDEKANEIITEKCIQIINTIRKRENIFINKENEAILIFNNIIQKKIPKEEWIKLVIKKINDCKKIKSEIISKDIGKAYKENSHTNNDSILLYQKLYKSYSDNDVIDIVEKSLLNIDNFIKRKEIIPKINLSDELKEDNNISKLIYTHLQKDIKDSWINHRASDDPYEIWNLMKSENINFKEYNENLYQWWLNIEETINNWMISPLHRSTITSNIYSNMGYNIIIDNKWQAFQSIVVIQKN